LGGGQSEFVDPTPYLLKPFAGCEICVTGLSVGATVPLARRRCVADVPHTEDREMVRATSQQLGGRYSAELLPSFTHLIAASATGAKYDAALTMAGKHIVTLQWFLDSARMNGARTVARCVSGLLTVLRAGAVQEARYPVRPAPDPAALVSVPSGGSRLSGPTDFSSMAHTVMETDVIECAVCGCGVPAGVADVSLCRRDDEMAGDASRARMPQIRRVACVGSLRAVVCAMGLTARCV
jgi:hypothetical protein